MYFFLSYHNCAIIIKKNDDSVITAIMIREKTNQFSEDEAGGSIVRQYPQMTREIVHALGNG